MKAIFIGPKPVFETDAEFLAGLEEAGEAAVRAELQASQSVARREDKLKWLHAKDLARQETAIAAAQDAALAAQKSARWAIWSAVIAVVAVIVAVTK